MHAACLKPACHIQMVGSPWHQILPVMHGMGPGAYPGMRICERHNKGVGLSHSNEDGGLAGSDPEIHLAGFRNGACGGSSCPAGMPSRPKTLYWYLLYMLGVTYPCSSLSLLSWGPLVPWGGLLSCIVSDLHFRRGMRLPHFVYRPYRDMRWTLLPMQHVDSRLLAE